MTLLDTDHVSVLLHSAHSLHVVLTERMADAPDKHFAIPIICAEEQLRGWLAKISSTHVVSRQVPSYDNLSAAIGFFGNSERVPFDVRAADRFERLRKQKIRVGSQDLKIASIALVHDAVLLSANLRDFCKVPGLRVESWLAGK
jgi:tRNA(fMet)-specific endonuclease VapC